MEFASGDRYKGGFRDGAMHGRGQWEGVTGEVYVGDFAHGRRHGVGSLIGANGETVKSGRWEDGQFVNWDEANVHVLTHALHYGFAAFEGIRCYKGSKGSVGSVQAGYGSRVRDVLLSRRACVPPP